MRSTSVATAFVSVTDDRRSRVSCVGASPLASALPKGARGDDDSGSPRPPANPALLEGRTPRRRPRRVPVAPDLLGRERELGADDRARAVEQVFRVDLGEVR